MDWEEPSANSPEHVASMVSDPRLVGERRAQILQAAVKLFAENGYHTSTIQQIGRHSGVSIGLIYQYFGDKDDILFLALKQVLDTYESEIPHSLQGIEHPVHRLRHAIGAYCAIVDKLRDATLLAYHSTRSLRADRRCVIQDAETRTNRLVEECVRGCVEGGYMREVNEYLLVYQIVMFCHAWALKHWALRKRYGLEAYVAEGVRLLLEPFVTAKGRAALASLRRRADAAAGGRPAARTRRTR